MENEQQSMDALQDIRRMMKESSKFLSLSGLSGVFAGLYALAGAGLVHKFVSHYNAMDEMGENPGMTVGGLISRTVFVAGCVLFFSILTALLLSARKAKKNGQRLFDHTSKKLFWTMAIPLGAGGLFCVALLVQGIMIMIAPVMLLFYGTALVSASRYTMSDVRFLGVLEIITGLISAFLPGYGLWFWAIGFGVLHIIYGSIIWFKYDRTEQ
jgi:hypothetical protein